MSVNDTDLAASGYALRIAPGEQRWTWAISNPQARIAARGEAPDRETARRSGMFAATAIEALASVGRRRF